MHGQLFGDHALLLECGSAEQARSAYAEAQRRRDAGELDCVDILPGATTVLLDGLRDPESLCSELGSWSLEAGTDDVGELVELPVTYDGPDLESVAEHSGLSVDEVISAHREADYVVAFCGFAPGFAYLTGAPEALHVPRLDEPRSKVPAGSVGLAGAFTGVYPRSSPGGWRLVARTEARLWELDRDPPAVLAPGTRVRFTDA